LQCTTGKRAWNAPTVAGFKQEVDIVERRQVLKQLGAVAGGISYSRKAWPQGLAATPQAPTGLANKPHWPIGADHRSQQE